MLNAFFNHYFDGENILPTDSAAPPLKIQNVIGSTGEETKAAAPLLV